ncbi:MAG: hypothetical protein AAB669_03475 [Patescibacteria group bacterium]
MKKIWWIVIGVVVVIVIISGVVWSKSRSQQNGSRVNVPSADSGQSQKDSIAVAAGKMLTNNNCKGEGPGVLTRLPMDEPDYAMILPYGLMVGGHVTPIDHQYFSPTIFNSPRDTYPVYAMADSKIVDIQPRTNERGTEYRFVFTMTCTFQYYYDLVTSLTPELKTAVDSRQFNIDVKAGDLVGRIGGQTLDFAVWDTTKPLKNFVNPKSYESEIWKIYTADPLDYYTPEIKVKALAKYIRTTAPLSGRIDYDIDGKLIGSWFLKDSGGYAGPGGGSEGYWAGHLAIAPEYIDNSATVISFGSWNGGEAKQFTAKNPIDPATVGVASALTKYELYVSRYYKPDGQMWDNMKLAHDLKLKISESELGGCVLFQLTSARELRVEQFAKKKCTAVAGFSGQEKTYER